MKKSITKTQAAKSFKKIAKELMNLHTEASDYISRKDNNEIFEMSFFLEAVAKRIQIGYNLPLEDSYFKNKA